MSNFILKPIYCFISNYDEYQTMELVANIMSHRFSLATNKNISIEIRCHNVTDMETISDLDDSYVIYSLLNCAEAILKISDIEKQLVNLCTHMRNNRMNRLYFLNLFQYIEILDSQKIIIKSEEKISKIRAINLLALNLSQSQKCRIIDLDSIFTRLGAQNLQTDYTLKGGRAHQIAADFISTTLIEEHLESIDHLNTDANNHLHAGGYEGVLKRALKQIAIDTHNKINN